MCTFPLRKSYYSDEYLIDHTSHDSDDLDADDMTSLLTGWEDGSSDPGLKTPVQAVSHEKVKSVPDVADRASTERAAEPPPASEPLSLDLEADITVGEGDHCSLISLTP